MPTHHRKAGRARDLPGTSPTLDFLEQRALLAVDPVTTNHPLWIAERTSEAITLDGRFDEAAWAAATPIERSLVSLPNCGVTLRMLYTADGLKVGAQIRDLHLYADGDGLGARRGSPWDYFNDDALALYFDVKETRNDVAMPASGRVLALNAAPFNSRTSGNGVQWRRNFMRGNPAAEFHQTFINPDGSPPAGLAWKTRLMPGSTLAKTGDTDTGWQVEISIPWSALGLRKAPPNGRTMGMNFQVFFDNNGGTIEYRDVPDFAPTERYDAKITAVPGSEGFDELNGWPQPVGYAVLQFAAAGAAPHPASIDTLAVQQPVGGYSANLHFTAPAGTLSGARLNAGHASSYQIRVSSGPILTQSDWERSTPIANAFQPKRRGEAESLRIAGLSPNTSYFVAVRAADTRGRLGDLSGSVAFTTASAAADPSAGQRIIVSPEGSTLVTESLDPFPMIGGTVGIHNLYIRGLYSGGVWPNSGGREPVDFSQPDRHPEGEASGYFAALAASGVNVLRLQMEWLVKPDGVSNGRFRQHAPDGIRWIEWRDQGSPTVRYNEQMGEFLRRAIDAAHAAGIRFVIQTSNNFNYDEHFDLTTFASSRGGPIDSLDQLFDTNIQGLQARQLVKDRLHKLTDWVRSSSHPETVIGFELYNEWDGGIQAPDVPPGLSVEQQQRFIADDRRDQLIKRAKFLEDVSHDLRAYAPELLVFGTVIGTEPDGPLARSLFYTDTFDVLNPHFYAPAVSQPAYNTDADKSLRVARDYGAIATYWLSNRIDNRPIHNGEWDITGVGKPWPSNDSQRGPYYTDQPNSRNLSGLPAFTLAEDEANYRVASWSNIASGLAGAGWRIGSGPLPDIYPANPQLGTHGILPVPLSPAMRATQSSIAAFFAGDTLGFDWVGYRPRSLAGHVSTSSSGAGQRFVSVGSTDGEQGLAYIVRDASFTAPFGAELRIESLTPSRTFMFELWDTSGASQPTHTITAATDNAGRVVVALPAFDRDLVVRFRASPFAF